MDRTNEERKKGRTSTLHTFGVAAARCYRELFSLVFPLHYYRTLQQQGAAVGDPNRRVPVEDVRIEALLQCSKRNDYDDDDDDKW